MLWSFTRLGFGVIHELFSTKFDVRIALALMNSHMCLVMIFEFLSQLWSNSNLSVGNCPIYPKTVKFISTFQHRPFTIVSIF